jgi:hypothetical protein
VKPPSLTLLNRSATSDVRGQTKETVVHDDDYGPWDD